jgi:hypothetical protein
MSGKRRRGRLLSGFGHGSGTVEDDTPKGRKPKEAIVFGSWLTAKTLKTALSDGG